MDLLDRLLQHDAWTTRQLLDRAAALDEAVLDRELDIGHRTIRATLNHVIHNMEVWSALMAGVEFHRENDCTVTGMIKRFDVAAERLRSVARRVSDDAAWDEKWLDHLDDPPREKSYGTAIAHILTHSMHHRAQLLYMLRLAGCQSLPEGDVFSWESATS